MLQIAIFVLVSAGLVYVSRGSLRDFRLHGFYRFFAWEAILALALLNAAVWFRDPFSWHQLVSWTFLVISLIPLVLGVRLLRTVKRAEQERQETGLLGFEKTAELVTVGVYRYIRHPMYSSLLFLVWGVFFKTPSPGLSWSEGSLAGAGWLGVALVLAATGFLAATARIEERENVKFFGPTYEAYMKRTKMFIPFVF
jgi:protein-S-isoprenylcysteine O-methyltransferase Ste14